MNKNKKILIIVILSVIAIFVGGYFLVEKFNLLPKGKMEYTKESAPEITEESEKNPEKNVSNEEPEKIDKSEENTKKGDLIKNEITVPLAEEKTDKAPIEEKKESQSESGKIVDRLMKTGFKVSSGRKIDTIIVHTSYNAIGSDPYDIRDIIKQYEQYEVSAHYLIGRDGTIYRLVKDKDIAWHAGVSKMPDGRTNINDFSIGIEVVNTKEGKFSKEEYEALNSLIKDLKEKYGIKYVLGHDDIAPTRKTDPWGIEWDRVNK